MKKLILLWLVLVNVAFAYNYDDVLLKAQASIFPKIMLLDKKLNEKLVDGKIVYTIVYDTNDDATAQEIKEFIDAKYKGHLDKYEYVVNLVSFSNFSKMTKASAVYVLNLSDHIKDIASIAREKGIISFAYDISNLRKGLMFSLAIEKSTVLYLERENLYSQKIDFVDSLLQMVRFVDSHTFADKVLFNDYQNSVLMYANEHVTRLNKAIYD